MRRGIQEHIHRSACKICTQSLPHVSHMICPNVLNQLFYFLKSQYQSKRFAYENLINMLVQSGIIKNTFSLHCRSIYVQQAYHENSFHKGKDPKVLIINVFGETMTNQRLNSRFDEGTINAIISDVFRVPISKVVEVYRFPT